MASFALLLSTIVFGFPIITESSIVYAVLHIVDEGFNIYNENDAVKLGTEDVREAYISKLNFNWNFDLYSAAVSWNRTVPKFEDHPKFDFVLLFNDHGSATLPESISQLERIVIKDTIKIKSPFEVKSPYDCSQLPEISTNISYNAFKDGKYTLVLNEMPVEVYCEFSSDTWTRIQSHQTADSNEKFTQNSDYDQFFGDVLQDHWLGLDNIAFITNKQTYQLQIDLQDCNGTNTYIVYENFVVGDKSTHYKLSITLPKDQKHARNPPGDSIYNPMYFITGKTDSTPTDDQFSQLGNVFSTQSNNGGWWFNDNNSKFNLANLNGAIEKECKSEWPKGLVWNTWHGATVSIKAAAMKIRAV